MNLLEINKKLNYITNHEDSLAAGNKKWIAQIKSQHVENVYKMAGKLLYHWGIILIDIQFISIY